MSNYLTVKQAAEYVNLSVTTIREAMHRAGNPLTYISTPGGGKHLIDIRDLEAWMEGLKR